MSEYVQVSAEFLKFLRCAPVSSGICVCGDSMDVTNHGDHAAVDMWDHNLGLWLKQIEDTAALRAHPAGGGSRETAAEVLVHYDGFLGEKTPFHPDTSLQERRSMRIACMENALRAAGIGAGVVPEGWKLVRLMPDEETIAVAWQAVDSDRISEIDVEKILRAGIAASTGKE